MATNTYKIPGRERKTGSFFAMVERFLRIDESLTEVIHVRFLPQILFVCGLTVVYIGNRHFAEKTIRDISVLEQRVEDLRADYTTLKADYMFSSKQSEVAKKAAALGLKESNDSPEKIIVKK